MKTKSPHLILLAAAAVAVTCEPQRINNDVIWYPVDDEDGVFISTFGEKYRTSPNGKWRSHRRARYSGTERVVPLSYDPSENYDSSFFHNINERRPTIALPPIPKIPPSFQNQRFTVTKHPQNEQNGQNVNENFQEIINEVFDYSRYPAGRPETTSVWGGGQNQMTGNQWSGSTSGLSGNPFPGNPWLGNKKPSTGNLWGSTSGNQFGTVLSSRPTKSEWIVTTSGSNRPNVESDKLVFPDEFTASLMTTTTTPSSVVPKDTTTMSPCERLCPVTPEFNPVCGSDGNTYSNAGRLKCALMCGKNVSVAHHGNCGRTGLVTPLISNNRKEKFKRLWQLGN